MIYFIIAIIILLDQGTKYMVITYLKDKPAIPIINNILEFVYVENYGAAFGILQNRRVFFVVITFLIILTILFLLINNYYYFTKPMRVALAMLVGGAIGNLIDRIRLGYVVDFISVKFGNTYNFPVFNVADSFIVVATILIIWMVIFNKYEV